MPIIRIHDLKAMTIIGVHPSERIQKQAIRINIVIQYDSSQAEKKDSLKDALDYEFVANMAVKVVQGSKCLLIERLTSKLINKIMMDKRIENASVCLVKPKAIAQARCVSFESSQSRN